MARSKADKARSFLDLSAHRQANPKSNYPFEFLLVGDAQSGKSCLVNRWGDDSFSYSYKATIGVDFKVKKIQLDGETITCRLWDSSGNAIERSIIRPIYRGAHCIIIAFDLTNADSFHHLQDWINEARSYNTGGDNTKLLIVGTKADLVEKRVVSAQQAQAFCDSQKISYIETSALTGQNVNQVLETAAKKALENAKPAKQQRSTPETDHVRSLLIYHLNNYIQRIESHPSKVSDRPDFSYGFWFFSQSRAINREANYYLAVQLRDKLKSSEESVEGIFSNINERRKEIINSHQLNTRPAFSDRGINSSELNGIIDSVRNVYGMSY
jgi:Ras-related protein Rab-1A